nr:hypothetical protein [uncultured Arsenicibacter sp.]
MKWFLWFRVASNASTLIRRVPEGFFRRFVYGLVPVFFLFLTAPVGRNRCEPAGAVPVPVPDIAGQIYPATGPFAGSFLNTGHSAGEGSSLTARHEEGELLRRTPATSPAVWPGTRQRSPALALHRDRALAWKPSGRP